MRTVRHVTAAAVASVLLLSPVVAAWSSFGSYEPDSDYDTADYMWAEPGPASADRIYFNAWSSTQTFVNYNVGAIETANEAPQMERHSAILGVWVDCNGDGYVGYAESALYEYSSTLLLDDSICPPITGDANEWVEGAHNYNGWVSELVPIGRPFDNGGDPKEVAQDTRVYRDPEAKIWADQGRPEDTLEGTGGDSCAINPFPRGTMQSTGGFLNYVDCNTGLLEIYNLAWSDSFSAVGTEIPGPGDPLGLRFQNDDDANGHALDVDTFGPDSSDHAAVSVTDCSAEPFVDTAASVNQSAAGPTVNGLQQAAEDEMGEDLPEGWELYGLKVWPVSPETNTEDPTLPGQTNQTFEETGDCDFSNDNGQDFYGALNEGDNIGNGGFSGKTSSMWSFTYHEGNRGNDMGEFLFGIGTGNTPESDGTAGTATGFGVGACVNLCATGWYGIGNLIKVPATVVTRGGFNTDDPLASDPGVDIAPGYYLSFYAYVSPAVTAGDLNLKTPGGQGFYGSSQCGDNTSGIHGGWNCDPTQWNVNPDGTVEDGADLLAFVHDLYTLRDVDCYDGSTNLGVGLGLPYYGNEPCARPN